MSRGFWILLWFHLCLGVLSDGDGSPTTAPTMLSENDHLVEMVVTQNLVGIDAGQITEKAKDVFATAVQDSLVCCEDYNINITNVKSLSSRRRLRGSREDIETTKMERALGDETPTAVFDYTLSFLYLDASVEYSSRSDAFSFIKTVLTKSIDGGAFQENLVSSSKSCISSTCAVYSGDFSVGAYTIGPNKYIPSDPVQSQKETEDDGVGLAVGLTFLMFFSLTVFFYMQYCWGYLPCYDKYLKRKWKEFSGMNLFGEEFEDIEMDDGDGDEEAEKAFEEYLSHIKVEDNEDITALADPQVRFGRGHHERRRSLMKAQSLHLEGSFIHLMDSPDGAPDSEPSRASLRGIFGSIDEAGPIHVASPLHGIGEEEEENEDEEEDEASPDKEKEKENAALGIGASTLEAFYEHMPEQFNRESTFARMSMAKVMEAHNQEEEEEEGDDGLFAGGREVRRASTDYEGGGERGSTLDNFQYMTKSNMNTTRGTRSRSDSDSRASWGGGGGGGLGSSILGAGLGKPRRPSDSSDEQKDAYKGKDKDKDKDKDGDGGSLNKSVFSSPSSSPSSGSGGLRLSPGDKRRPSLLGVVKRPPGSTPLGLNGAAAAGTGAGLLSGGDNTVSLESNPVVRASKFPSRRRMSSIRGGSSITQLAPAPVFSPAGGAAAAGGGGGGGGGGVLGGIEDARRAKLQRARLKDSYEAGAA